MQAADNVLRDAMRSLRQTDSPLAALFFDAANLDAVQGALVREVAAKGFTVSRQSDREVTLVMRSMYESFAREPSRPTNKALGAEVERLNAVVLEVLVEQVLAGAQQFLDYIRDASTLPEPIDRGVNPSIKGVGVKALGGFL